MHDNHIRNHNNVATVIKSLDLETELVTPAEFNSLVIKTVAACERAGVKMPPRSFPTKVDWRSLVRF